jgi:hypothetical protein
MDFSRLSFVPLIGTSCGTVLAHGDRRFEIVRLDVRDEAAIPEIVTAA